MPTKITSAEVIRNADKPRVGVTSKASCDFLDAALSDGIDLGRMSAEEDVTAEVIAEYKNESNGNEDEHWIDDEVSLRLEGFESTGPYLVGDWKRADDGFYEIDTDGRDGYAAIYSPETNIVTVEWSRTTKRCHHTSPCFVMANGSGPCGDLDTSGDSVVAYTLPDDCFEH